jgi:hypothetical protein
MPLYHGTFTPSEAHSVIEGRKAHVLVAEMDANRNYAEPVSRVRGELKGAVVTVPGPEQACSPSFHSRLGRVVV